MAWMKKDPSAHFARRATRRASLRDRDPRRFKRTVGIILGCVAVVVLALIWGNHLKKESDARRAAEEADQWLLEEATAVPIPVAVPSVNAGWAAPSQKMQTSRDLTYSAVTFSLGSCLTPQPYRVALPEASGLSVTEGAPDLESEVRRFKNAGLYVIGVFTVTSFDTNDMTERTLRRGQEMALLSLYAKAGIDDLLLLGLPTGNDTADASAVSYLREVEALLASIPVSVPAVGVALYPTAFVGETPAEDGSLVYAGSLTPGRMLAVCDYLALDLRETGGGTAALLKEMQYAYVRYDLRLLTPLSQPEIAEAAATHGFSRIWEYGQ